jgi:quercetin dioxygenase-like cupin family protein
LPSLSPRLLATPLAAQVKFSSTPILQSGVTNGGGPIAYPATDSAEVTALRVDIGPGGETGRHMHLYSAFVYVLEGAVDVEMKEVWSTVTRLGIRSSRPSTPGTTASA